MHKCCSYFECLHCQRRICAVKECGKELTEADICDTMEFKTVGYRCAHCEVFDDATPRLAIKVLALREAWLDLPFTGIVPPGWGDPIQNLVNAVTEIVDPERTLRELSDSKRRGDIASLRTKAEWHAEQVALGTKANQTAEEIAVWAGKRDAAIAECRERFGVDIIIPKREPWTP